MSVPDFTHGFLTAREAEDAAEVVNAPIRYQATKGRYGVKNDHGVHYVVHFPYGPYVPPSPPGPRPVDAEVVAYITRKEDNA